jgi:hypothetical protein
VDITQLILDDHHEQRRLFAILEQIDRSDAIGDHNEIRDAVAEVARHSAGSDGWYAAVAGPNRANGDHMAEEDQSEQGGWPVSDGSLNIGGLK